MIFWCLNNKTISNYKKSTYGSFMCMLFDAYIQGSNMLMIDLNRIKNDYTFQDDVAKFIDDILELEQTHIDALKSFL